jgi:hypothetical protein
MGKKESRMNREEPERTRERERDIYVQRRQEQDRTE